MQEHELPTRNDIVGSALGELDHSRDGLSEAASWLRSDWRPLGSAPPDGAGETRAEVLKLTGEARGLVQAKGALYGARRGGPA